MAGVGASPPVLFAVKSRGKWGWGRTYDSPGSAVLCLNAKARRLAGLRALWFYFNYTEWGGVTMPTF